MIQTHSLSTKCISLVIFITSFYFICQPFFTSTLGSKNTFGLGIASNTETPVFASNACLDCSNLFRYEGDASRALPLEQQLPPQQLPYSRSGVLRRNGGTSGKRVLLRRPIPHKKSTYNLQRWLKSLLSFLPSKSKSKSTFPPKFKTSFHPNSKHKLQTSGPHNNQAQVFITSNIPASQSHSSGLSSNSPGFPSILSENPLSLPIVDTRNPKSHLNSRWPINSLPPPIYTYQISTALNPTPRPQQLTVLQPIWDRYQGIFDSYGNSRLPPSQWTTVQQLDTEIDWAPLVKMQHVPIHYRNNFREGQEEVSSRKPTSTADQGNQRTLLTSEKVADDSSVSTEFFSDENASFRKNVVVGHPIVASYSNVVESTKDASGSEYPINTNVQRPIDMVPRFEKSSNSWTPVFSAPNTDFNRLEYAGTTLSNSFSPDEAVTKTPKDALSSPSSSTTVNKENFGHLNPSKKSVMQHEHQTLQEFENETTEMEDYFYSQEIDGMVDNQLKAIDENEQSLKNFETLDQQLQDSLFFNTGDSDGKVYFALRS